MAVKPGYKQTEVGVIPEDWETTTIAGVASIKTGPFGTLLKASEYSKKGGVPLISVGEVRQGFFRITEETPRVCSAVTRRLPQYLLAEGDIVFGRKGGVDRSAVVKSDQKGWFLGSDGLAIRPSRKICSNFLGAQFQTSRVKDWLIQNAIGTTMPSLNQGILGGVVIFVPPTLTEQEAIAEALSDADALIESLEQLIAKKRLLKQGAMQQLLTCLPTGRPAKRLPGFEGEWEVKKLGALGSFSKGSGVRKHEANSGGAACIRYGEIYTRHHDWVRTIYSRISPAVAATARRLSKGDLLFAGSGETREEIGKCVAFLGDEETYAGGDIVILRPSKADSLFMGYYFNTPYINYQKAGKGQGDAVVHISSNALADIDINIPERAEQTAIAAILSDMDAEIAALESKLAKARQVKQGMMQELLTGKTRLVGPASNE